MSRRASQTPTSPAAGGAEEAVEGKTGASGAFPLPQLSSLYEGRGGARWRSRHAPGIFRVEFPDEPCSAVMQAASSLSAQIRLIQEQRTQLRRLKRRQVAPLPRKHWLYIQAKRLEEMDSLTAPAASAAASAQALSSSSPSDPDASRGGPGAEEDAAQGASIFSEDGGDIDAHIRAWRRRKGLPEDPNAETGKERRRRLREERKREQKRKVRWELPSPSPSSTPGEHAAASGQLASAPATGTQGFERIPAPSSAPSADRLLQLEAYGGRGCAPASPQTSTPSPAPGFASASSVSSDGDREAKPCFTWDWQEGQGPSAASTEAAREAAAGLNAPLDEGRERRRRKSRKERRAEILANRQAVSLGAPPHWMARNKVEPHRFIQQLALTETPSPLPSRADEGRGAEAHERDCMHTGGAAAPRGSRRQTGSSCPAPGCLREGERLLGCEGGRDAGAGEESRARVAWREAEAQPSLQLEVGADGKGTSAISAAAASATLSAGGGEAAEAPAETSLVAVAGARASSSTGGGRGDSSSDRFSDGLLDSGASLVRQLKRRALQYEATGVDPSLLDAWASSAGYYPGIERHQRATELRELSRLSFQDLLASGRGSVKNFNALIKARVYADDFAAALDILEKMGRHGFPPDEESFVHLIGGAARQGDSAAARMLFLKMRCALASPPSSRVYAALIQAHVAAGDLVSAFALLRKMDDEHIAADCVVHTVLIDGLVKAKKLRKAWRTFWNMRTWKGIEPDEVLFTVMIKACAVRGEAERAVNLLDDLRASGLHPTDVTYSELMHACCDRKDFASKCFHFYQQMLAEDMPITPAVYAFLLRACAAQGNVKRAKDVVRQMVAENVPFSPYLYTLVIRVFASAMRLPRVSDAERIANLRYAWHIVQDMRAKGVKLETKTLNALLEVYVAGGFSQYAVEMLKHYHELGCEPDIYTYKALLTMFARDLKDVGRFFALWDFMRRHTSLSPPPDLLHLALSTAMDSQSASRTVKVLQEMYALKVFPTPQLTDRLARVGREITAIHEMIGLFVKLQKQDVFEKNRKEQQLLQTQIDEHELKVFANRGVTLRADHTPEQEVRKEFFDKQDKAKKAKYGGNRRPWMPLGEFLQSKQKGGENFAKKHDRPRPPPEVEA
ncbi:pentatricopeptide repeat domain-containing protein [Besnoitia besnoiti]|uniref:Pentatricopeptide repeat domain-containing protein n=1 Tax=Besnoitia besnoiti TaxID=94643 RepID=A0A2A9MLW0_BESBE|nr:pentatricopeptide repeat domain-containing protein [Besnoitia besnoiti]PFH36480.1 pentatricopeptide repeat domain-containing protein [Besnoitia besnoiti]